MLSINNNTYIYITTETKNNLLPVLFTTFNLDQLLKKKSILLLKF